MEKVAKKCVFKKPTKNWMPETPILWALMKSILTVQKTPVK